MNEIPAGNDIPTETHSSSTTWKRAGLVLRCLLVAMVLVAGGVLLAGRWALQKTREVPDFYLQAAARMPVDSRAASKELEVEVQELTTQVGRLGSWQATFTEAQINAWLLHQLPREFSRIFPAGVEEPRVAIREGKVLAAARYKDSRIETVVSFELDIQLTAEPNVLAIEIRDLRAGALPLPLSRFVGNISRRAARDELEVRWDKEGSGAPIALVTVPSEHPSYLRTPVVVESVTLSDGTLRLAGHTGPEARTAYQPRGPVYRLASMRTGAARDAACETPGSTARTGVKSRL